MDHNRKTVVCVVSGVWASVVVIYTLFHILKMEKETVFGHFAKIATLSLAVAQFMLSGMLLSYARHVQTKWTRRYYMLYLLVAVTTSILYLIYYASATTWTGVHFFWGFSYFDIIMYIDIFVFIIFIICYPTPKTSGIENQGRNNNGATRRRNVDWIARDVVPQRVIVEHGHTIVYDEKRIDNNNTSSLPYARMSNESIA